MVTVAQLEQIMSALNIEIVEFQQNALKMLCFGNQCSDGCEPGETAQHITVLFWIARACVKSFRVVQTN